MPNTQSAVADQRPSFQNWKLEIGRWILDIFFNAANLRISNAQHSMPNAQGLKFGNWKLGVGYWAFFVMQ
jgi:hypothetical protein